VASPKKPDDVPDVWGIEFFKRHEDDDPKESVPAREFLDEIPAKVAARIVTVIQAVADAPPPKWSGGGFWETMHDEMAGYYEVRVDHARIHYRLCCRLERNGQKVGLDGPSIVTIAGRSKTFGTVISKHDYARVREMGAEYLRRNPRSVEG
jgi:hypothetical protein